MQYHSNTLNFLHIPEFIPPDLSENIFTLLEQLPWKKKHGERAASKRTNILFSDAGLMYSTVYFQKRYSRLVHPWDELEMLTELKQLVEGETSTSYNCCSIMRYPTPDVGIGRHRDKEMILGTTICGLSFGAPRTFKLYPPNYGVDRSVEEHVISVRLQSGSMYAMFPPTNSLWTHEIAKESEESISEDLTSHVRYSLTFRNAPPTTLCTREYLHGIEEREQKLKEEIQICTATYLSGKNKGQKCTHPSKPVYSSNEPRCGIHKMK